jgi:hypothetical protein
MKQVCPNCDKRVFDIPKLPKGKTEIEMKCPRCKKMVSISCGGYDSEFAEDNLVDRLGMPFKANGLKDKILFAAMDLFAKNGYYETEIKEIAALVGIKESTLFGHYDSKNALLDATMKYYQRVASSFIPPLEKIASLNEDATAEDVMSCLFLSFPQDESVHYINALHVMFQEHCRNNDIREFFADNMIL